MAIVSHFQLILLLSLCTLLFKSCSWSPERVSDYERWVSWNVANYQKRTVKEAESLVQTPGSSGTVLDLKLRNAEMNRVRKSVSQDGTGDFKTIKEALDSIPLHNIKRVILDIKPGVYSDPPTITGNDTASATGRNGMPLKTFQSATVAVDANYFVAINVKFEKIPHN
ncbi:hypothetical protein L1049_012582 [Liquidambar formosana]|uniref:pectinesterase n=1 Tax=Liquidambar formosana TaxID=63359 RepID=A0AAP0R2K9_LIQFO